MKREVLFLSALVTGCGAYEAPVEGQGDWTDSAATTYTGAQQQVQQDLQTLASLELFEVGELVVTSDMMPGICYGPCEDDADREERYIEQAARLHGLVAAAVDSTGVACDDVESSLDQLHALEIVQVGQLVEAQPETTGNCYGPCPDEVEEAEQQTEERAERVCELAQTTQGL